MKKALSLLLSVIMAVTSCLAVPVLASAEDTVTTVNLNEKYQTMNGFGASACWWSQDVGGWDNAKEIMSYLYSEDNGIGLNIYRYNLGAGSKDDNTLYVLNRRTESFLNADGTYNWNNDANAQKCLELAKGFAGDDMRVALFCNSAPVNFTKNGKGYCDASDSSTYVSNLDSSNYQNFADYCYDCAEHFINNGYRVTEVSPINEPQYSWRGWFNADGSVSMGQEGCYYKPEEARELLKAFVKKFNKSELDKNGCKVSMFESGAIEGDDTTFSKYMKVLLNDSGLDGIANSTLRNYFDTVSVHSYWSSTDIKTAAASLMADKYSNYNIVQTEYCQMQDDWNTGVHDLVETNMTSGLTMEYGLALANIIYDDLTILNVNEWDWWTACAYGGYTDALVYLNETTHKIETSKRLWTLGNFSKFTDEGSVRIAANTTDDSLKTVAFSNPDGTVSIVLINSGTADVNTTLNLNGNDTGLSRYTTYVTNSESDLEQYQSGKSLDDEITIPAQSVATVVVDGHNHIAVTDNAAAPTCTETGLTQGSHCSVCGEVIIPQETVPATGHTSVVDNAVAPTCTVTGLTQGSHCSVCGEVLTQQQTVPATGHSYTATVVQPTCTSLGYTIHTCIFCGDTYTDSYVDQLAHSFGDNLKNCTVCGAANPNYIEPVKPTPSTDENVTSAKKTTVSKPKSTKISKLSKGKKQFKVTWKKISGVSGYQIQYSTDKKFKKNTKTATVKSSKTTSKTIKSLKSKKTYYVRVRTYKTVKVNGKSTKVYSSWSSAKSVKTK